MKKLLLALVLSIPLLGYAATAVMNMPEAQLKIRIYSDKACKLPGLPPEFRAAEVEFEDKKLVACWVQPDPAYVFIVDETGDSGVIPAQLFARETEV